MSDDLVKRLKDRLKALHDDPREYSPGQIAEASGMALTRIEELDTENAKLKQMWWDAGDVTDLAGTIADLQSKLRKSALQELSALGQASEAYQAQLAAEAKLAQQDDLVQAAVAAALTEAAQAVKQDAENDDISHGAAQWVADTILSLITPDAQTALDRALAAERDALKEAVDEVTEYAKRHEAERDALAEKLSKAVEALKEIAEQTKGVTPEPDNLQIAIGSLHSYARATLAELKRRITADDKSDA